MRFAKRIFLFLLLNFLVVMTISIVLSLFNIRPYFTAHGLDYQSLLIFCFIWGMTGALISLALSRIMAKWMLGVKPIDPVNCTTQERMLLEKVHRLAEKAQLPLPEVGIYSSPEVNAFATGPTKSRSLVAVSTGLLNRMNDKEIEGVLGHELAHIANGDMVTMTLLQGVVNAFVMFLARALAFVIASRGRDQKQASRGSYIFLVYLFEVVFMILGSMIIAAYSRFREFRADKGGAELAGKATMIASLQSLQRAHEIKDPREQPALAAFKISHPGKSWFWLFATHPPLEERIARLQ